MKQPLSSSGGLRGWAGLGLVLFAAGALRAAAPALEHGFDPARLRRVDALIQEQVERGRIAGGILYVARDGAPVRFTCYGESDRENHVPMAPDAVFRIASMSKAVTTVAVLQLYEEGKFLLHDPIEKYLPAFKGSVVAVPPPPDAAPGVKYVTVPAKRPITVHHLLTHTAGLTYGDGPAKEEYERAKLVGWYFADRDETIGEAIDRLAKLPLHGHPGEAWQYGFATDVLGRLVEVVSGQPLDRYLEEKVFRPLRMTDTCFFLPPAKAARLAPLYGFEGGRLVLKETAATSAYVHGPRKCFAGGAGLLSTAGDYARFLQMLLREGELDGVRLLAPGTVRLMHRNHTGDKYRRDAAGFGLGFWVNHDPGHYGELSGPGAYGWGSAYYPRYFVDPDHRLVGFFLAQLLPAGGNDLNQKFQVGIYQALID